ncbi:5-formyltetrahydrofolate cyclo-ligase [Sphingomonas sp. KR1UV-12]|uniref:5-formyltetrahydrofolate cyclo-ligase n=1 Tax=Sphingomonas aurea TaxID=3063994 RepID=A0ABT9EGQ3_9SPHN|nr:5-formyltetrahydrofolate cyclo-ligase [Sphingomonas sp. KR1UV-12]MDP1026074.1 5-formyltetrahydrofolate cyclo-ligase [Sphingomonas sp. KR1UV-12]
MTDKAPLRARLRAARDAAAGGRQPIVDEAFVLRLRPGMVVAAYLPTPGEADPAAFIDAARTMGCTLALPFVVDRPTPLRFLHWQGQLVAGPFGLRQPPAAAPELVPEIILTPLVGFDRRGNRLGQGAGHYDRAFAQHPSAWRVGIALGVQEVPALTPDPWDVPLHAIATESEWILP